MAHYPFHPEQDEKLNFCDDSFPICQSNRNMAKRTPSSFSGVCFNEDIIFIILVQSTNQLPNSLTETSISPEED